MIILCTVDITTREVTIPSDQRIASYDHKVDVIRFQVETIPGFSLDTSSIKIAAQGPNKARHDYAVDPSTVQIEEETGYITFDWPIPAGVTEMPIGTFKYGDKGQLIFAVCAEIISGNTVSKAWHSDDGIITVVAHLEPEAGGETPEEQATNAQKIAQLQTATAILQREIGGIASGTPPTASTIAEMDAETSTVYIYTGSESGESTGYWYYYNGTTFVPGGQYGGAVTSTTFTEPGVPADDFAVGQALALKADADDVDALDDRVTALESGSSGGLTADVKTALLACFRGLAWKGDADPVTLYQALDLALNPPANLSSITAVYTQSGAVDVGDSLESLREDLVVTAHYTDNTSAVVTSYTLSGTLTLGTSTITVSYGGKTTTFNVTVTSSWEYVWDLTSSLTDIVSGVTAVVGAGTGVNAPEITPSGLVFDDATQRLSLGDIDLNGKTIEIDVASFDFKGSNDYHMRFLVWGSNTGPMVYHKTNGWNAYALPSGSGSSSAWGTGWGSTSTLKKDRTIINGATVKLVFESENWNLYINGDLYGTITDRRVGTGTFDLSIGGTSGYSQSAGDQCYDMTISAIRIKTNPVTEGGDE